MKKIPWFSSVQFVSVFNQLPFLLWLRCWFFSSRPGIRRYDSIFLTSPKQLLAVENRVLSLYFRGCSASGCVQKAQLHVLKQTNRNKNNSYYADCKTLMYRWHVSFSWFHAQNKHEWKKAVRYPPRAVRPLIIEKFMSACISTQVFIWVIFGLRYAFVILP